MKSQAALGDHTMTWFAMPFADSAVVQVLMAPCKIIAASVTLPWVLRSSGVLQQVNRLDDTHNGNTDLMLFVDGWQQISRTMSIFPVIVMAVFCRS